MAKSGMHPVLRSITLQMSSTIGGTRTTSQRRVHHIDIAHEGIIITFQDESSAFFDAQWLYDHQDVSGNFPIGEDEADPAC